MHGTRRLLFVGMLGLLLPAAALGQRGGFNPEQMFQGWDANKDGVVTRDELRDNWSRERFDDYLRRAGATDGRLTKDGFTKAFQARMNERMGFGGGGAPGGGLSGRPRIDPAQFESMFKNFDRNGDGKIDKDEVQRTSTLKNEVATWDTSKDGAIDLTEWKVYLDGINKGQTSPNAAAPAPMPPATPNGATPPTPDPMSDPAPEPKKETPAPTVFRAGQLPSEGLPSWFKDLDKDNDGQVALHEWPGDRPMKEFEDADRNGDGFVTIAEGLRFTRLGNGKANGGDESAKDKDKEEKDKDKDKDKDGGGRDRRRR